MLKQPQGKLTVCILQGAARERNQPPMSDFLCQLLLTAVSYLHGSSTVDCCEQQHPDWCLRDWTKKVPVFASWGGIINFYIVSHTFDQSCFTDTSFFMKSLVVGRLWLTVAELKLWASLPAVFTAPVSVSGLSVQCLGRKPDFWECFT